MKQIKDQQLLEKIAQRIRELRIENKCTQVEFYANTRIHIARIEAGKTNISISTLHLICQYFNVSLRDFFAKVDQ